MAFLVNYLSSKHLSHLRKTHLNSQRKYLTINLNVLFKAFSLLSPHSHLVPTPCIYGHLTEIKALEDEVLSDSEISNISPWVDKELTDISVHPSNHTTYNFGAGGWKLPPKQIPIKKKWIFRRKIRARCVLCVIHTCLLPLMKFRLVHLLINCRDLGFYFIPKSSQRKQCF